MTNWGGSRPGAGRPAKQPGHKRKVLSATISEDNWLQVRAIAEHRGQSVSEVVDELLTLALSSPTIRASLLGGLEQVLTVPQAPGEPVAPAQSGEVG